MIPFEDGQLFINRSVPAILRAGGVVVGVAYFSDNNNVEFTATKTIITTDAKLEALTHSGGLIEVDVLGLPPITAGDLLKVSVNW